MNVFLFSANSKGSSFHVSCPQELPPLAACQSSMSTSVNDADQQLEAMQRRATISISADLLVFTNIHANYKQTDSFDPGRKRAKRRGGLRNKVDRK